MLVKFLSSRRGFDLNHTGRRSYNVFYATKHLVARFLVLCMLLGIFPAQVVVASQSESMQDPETPVPPAPELRQSLIVNVNGRAINLSQSGAFLAIGVSYIPVANVFRDMGYTVEWNEETRTATLRRGTIILSVTEGDRTFTINGNPRQFSAVPVIVDGSLMVPFLEIIESVGGRAYRDLNNAINIFVTI